MGRTITNAVRCAARGYSLPRRRVVASATAHLPGGRP